MRKTLQSYLRYLVFLTFVLILDICVITMLRSHSSRPRSTESDSTRATDTAAIYEDARYFPIPLSQIHADRTVSYEDSWMQSRSFGGARGHEGCDIMAGVNQRGLYPVVSVSDGIIEKQGWLPQGGWRIGIRSPGGVYFYYAHLYDYAPELAVGVAVHAGELLGFMGDSGYSEVEGTVGNFAVHLHFGIYLTDADGTEYSVNSYPLLQRLEAHKLSCSY